MPRSRDKGVQRFRAPWWRGDRGEWYVVVQVALFALVAFGPRTLEGWPSWPPLFALVTTYAGVVLMIAGVALAMAGLLRLGPNLTPLPYPRDDAHLVTGGPYALVRHPIYSGLIFAAFGIALFAHGTLTVLYAATLFAFFDVKSRREERWLVERFPDYPTYARRVKKLIPWVY